MIHRFLSDMIILIKSLAILSISVIVISLIGLSGTFAKVIKKVSLLSENAKFHKSFVSGA